MFSKNNIDDDAQLLYGEVFRFTIMVLTNPFQDGRVYEMLLEHPSCLT